MNQIENTISQVEKLYENLTGVAISDKKERHEPINSEIDPFALLDARINTLLHAIQNPMVQHLLQPMVPAMSAWESENQYLIRIEVPGVQKEDIDISVKGNSLVVSGRKKPFPLDKGFLPRMSEVSSGQFCRVIALPVANITSEISSNLLNGVLEISFPKAPTTKSSSKKTKSQ